MNAMYGTKTKWMLAGLAAMMVLGSVAVAEAHRHRSGRGRQQIGPGDTAAFREKAGRKLDALRRRVEALGEAGRLRPAEVERFRRMHTRAVERSEMIFSDGRVTPEEIEQLQRMRRHFGEFKRAVRARVGPDAWRQTRPQGDRGGRGRGRGHGREERGAGGGERGRVDAPALSDERWEDF